MNTPLKTDRNSYVWILAMFEWNFLVAWHNYTTEESWEYVLAQKQEVDMFKPISSKYFRTIQYKQKMDFDITHQGTKERSVETAFSCQEKIKFNSARFGGGGEGR